MAADDRLLYEHAHDFVMGEDFDVFMIPILNVPWATYRRDSHWSFSVVLMKNKIHERIQIVCSL